MEKYEFRIPVLVIPQILLQESHLLIAQAIKLAVVEHCKVRLLVIEAVVALLSGFLFVDSPGWLRPDVVVTGGEVEGIMPVALPGWAKFGPFGPCGGVVPPLNGVAHVDHEIRMQQIHFAPHAAIDFGLRAPGAVADNGEPKIVLRLIDGTNPNDAREERDDGRRCNPGAV